MAGELDAWAAAMPAGAATVTRKGDLLELATCDPGAGSTLTVTGNGSKALAMPAIRSYVEAGALFQGLTADQAGCAGAAFLDGYTVDQLAAPEGPPDLQAKLGQVYASCAAG
jgi:hypothetical protein